MKISDLIRKELVVTNLEVKTQEEVFKILFEKLLENGYVKETFLDAIINREKTFPTGLLLGNYNVAIPHTDAEHVLKPAIALATLAKPVIFQNMANPQEDVPVNIVFMLALNSPHSQVEMLQQLVNLIQNEDFLKRILNVEGGDEVIKIIKNHTLKED
ncbi:PTS sugar transporter subunit IIA [Thermosediminibacter oceani]|uniref:PTS IIA-like nitrogen-regulatory protein PtsN n=1 Tax=Thermosediminibacter oceani (strain ATCC BAA-1034 / DSM 16646 / JW/IW-1228P) TaxID=555079 RepID=D9RXX4_THEOJ|nr:PTS sugar transporter subunit IIA [Thermosediminibacter oceani]ADL08198.1 putative PTS IIA-like nitrogen-regulatory protein PtsN [Thermosediminibacter oceani DSM 16646]